MDAVKEDIKLTGVRVENAEDRTKCRQMEGDRWREKLKHKRCTFGLIIHFFNQI